LPAKQRKVVCGAFGYHAQAKQRPKSSRDGRLRCRHRLHDRPSITNGPETTGITIHGAFRYDLLTGFLGLGPRANSRMVTELAKIKSDDKVLDVGFGTGSLTLTAQSCAGANGRIYRIDAAPEMIEVAKKKASRSGLEVVFDVGLIEKLAFPDLTFDEVISRLPIHRRLAPTASSIALSGRSQ